jgi:anaerobic selenocysteine-containing dehydrogenase
MMHVLIQEDLIDHDYVAKYTLGYEELRQRALEWTPERTAETCGITAGEVVELARLYGQTARSGEGAAIRVNYGLQRVRGGGMAVRNITCLPALVGAWRHKAGGVQLSTSGSFPANRAALQRPDLLKGRTPRTINMTTIGDDLLKDASPEFGPKIEAVVDAHLAYGHLYMMANNAAIEPVGEAKPNTEFFRLLAARMGFDDPCFRETDDELAAQAFDKRHERAVHFDWESLKRKGWQKLNMPEAPFAEGGFPTPSGKCEFYSSSMARDGLDPVPTYIPPYESAASNPELARKYPLAMISPPARNFLNSTFVNVQSLRATEGEPHLDIHPNDAARRGIAHGDMARIFNDRGSFVARARVTDKAREGLVVGLSIWWKKLSSDGKNANEVTSQRLTDMGRAPTFYDTLVQVEKSALSTRDEIHH